VGFGRYFSGGDARKFTLRKARNGKSLAAKPFERLDTIRRSRLAWKACHQIIVILHDVPFNWHRNQPTLKSCRKPAWRGCADCGRQSP